MNRPVVRIAPGRSLSLGSRRKGNASGVGNEPTSLRLVAGDIVPDGVMTPDEVQRKAEDGFVIVEGSEYGINKNLPLTSLSEAGPIPSKETLVKDAPRIVGEKGEAISSRTDGVTTKLPNGMTTKVVEKPKSKEAAPVKSRASVWDFAPDVLRNKPLDELQAMALSRDERAVDEIDAWKSTDEAIKFMSRDYNHDLAEAAKGSE